jgi:hypothetical protein
MAVDQSFHCRIGVGTVGHFNPERNADKPRGRGRVCEKQLGSPEEIRIENVLSGSM